MSLKILDYGSEMKQKISLWVSMKADLPITRTCFKQLSRWLYTWTSPDGQYQNQTDYVIGSRRWKNCILSAKIRPEADCGTDYKLLLYNIRALKESQCQK